MVISVTPDKSMSNYHSVSPLWLGTYRGYSRPIGHVLNENGLGMISQQRQDITT